eukprot:g5093.t1
MPDNPDHDGCLSRGCCWDTDIDGDVPCFAKHPVGGVCPYHKNSKINCHPEPNATKVSCEARGCCWDEEAGESWCYPKGPTPRAPAIKLKGQAAEKEWGKDKAKTDTEAMPKADSESDNGELGVLSTHRACSLVQLDPGSKEMVEAVPGNAWGVYELQYQTLNKMPVYKQHTFLCKPSVYDGSSNTDFSCTQKHFEENTPAPHWIYYDGQQRRWMVGKSPAKKDVHVCSALSFDAGPDLVQTWEASRVVDGELMVKRAPSIVTKCMKNPHETHGRSKSLPGHVLRASEDSKCIRWRKTAGCDPNGPREPESDQGCDSSIGAEVSGFCECASGIKHKVACGHKPFTCADACKITFPHVLAQSGERTWTNQVARNLVRPTGDWLSSQTKKQWVIFDLGTATRVRAVEFRMWGSDANPKDVMVESSSTYSGPWSVQKRVTLPKLSKHYMTHIEPTDSRYWRLLFKDNWGADWGLGLSHVRFVSHLKAKARPDPCQTFTTKESCIYLSVTSSNMNTVGNGRTCGWCESSKACMSGAPERPLDNKCNGAWLWNSLTDTVRDSCLAYQDCDACSKELACGWCVSSSDCRSNYCKHWSGRACGPVQKLQGQESREAQQLKKQFKVGGGLAVAAGLLLIPTAVMFKRRADYWSTRRNMKDADVQWDQDASNIIEVKAYQSRDETAGERAGLLGQDEEA